MNERASDQRCLFGKHHHGVRREGSRGNMDVKRIFFKPNKTECSFETLGRRIMKCEVDNTFGMVFT